jgi:uncharacterized protein YecT (DUF1311 family)
MVKLLAASLCMLVFSESGACADEAYDGCMKKAQSNADFAECGGAYMKRADDALNAEWKKVYPLASGQTAKDLLTEEQAWIVFKDKSCLLYSNGENGREGEVISYPACRAGVIENRTRDLISIGKDLAPH